MILEPTNQLRWVRRMVLEYPPVKLVLQQWWADVDMTRKEPGGEWWDVPVCLPDLEFRCEECIGGVVHQYGELDRSTWTRPIISTEPCAACKGKGWFVTEAGKELLEFLKRHGK